MIDEINVDRRTVLRGVGTVALAGSIAGCSDSGGDGGDGGDGGTSASDYLSGANNFDGIVDKTGSDSVTVKVGAANGFAFGPAAIRIETGTTVTWEWTGNGGNHNVVAEDGTFDSGEAVPSGPFEHTFESSGTYNYFCQPHKMSGMKGSVVVE